MNGFGKVVVDDFWMYGDQSVLNDPYVERFIVLCGDLQNDENYVLGDEKFFKTLKNIRFILSDITVKKIKTDIENVLKLFVVFDVDKINDETKEQYKIACLKLVDLFDRDCEPMRVNRLKIEDPVAIKPIPNEPITSLISGITKPIAYGIEQTKKLFSNVMEVSAPVRNLIANSGNVFDAVSNTFVIYI